MPRLTITDMDKPPREYRPSSTLADFESAKDALAEDHRRADSLRRHRPDFAKHDRKVIKELERHLLSRPKRRWGMSCGSSFDMRYWRDRWPGWLVLYCTDQQMEPVQVTLEPNTWLFPAEQLQKVDPHKLMQQLRSDLNRSGAGGATGGLLCGLDSEYEPASGNFVFHAHGWVWGGMCEIVHRLRKTRKYQHDPDALRHGTGAVYPIRCDPVLETPLSSATYIGKSFWPERMRITLLTGGSARARGKQRIKGRPHAEMLLWFHRQRYAKLFLTMGLRVTRSGFQPLDPAYAKVSDDCQF